MFRGDWLDEDSLAAVEPDYEECKRPVIDCQRYQLPVLPKSSSKMCPK